MKKGPQHNLLCWITPARVHLLRWWYLFSKLHCCWATTWFVETCNLLSFLLCSRLADPPPLQQLMRLATDLVASKEGGGAANTVRGLTHSMAALTATELAVHLPANSHSKRGRAAMVRNEAAGVAVASSSHGNADTGSVDGRLQLMGLLPVDVQVGLLSGREAAGSGVQHMLIEPLQHAGFIAVSTAGNYMGACMTAA